jgi:hypothetical protein
MTIDLTSLSAQVATPRLLDWGSELVPSLGGVTQRLNRLGSRHAIDVVLPPMRIEPDGRLWISRLKRGKTEGVQFAFPQVEFDVSSPGTPLVKTAVSGGTSVALKGLTPRYAIKEGQWFSVIHSGRSYLHSSDAQVIVDASGDATVTVTPMLRTALSVNDVVNLGKPIIEGSLSGDEVAWTLEMARTVGLQFTVSEIA